MTGRAAPRAPWAGLAAGPVAWALSFQGNYLLVQWQCDHGARPVPLVAVLLAVVALAGGFISLQAWRRPASQLVPQQRAVTFIAAVGTLVAVLFALGIVLQATAGIIFTGCER